MNINNIKPLKYNIHSISNLYQGSTETDLNIEIREYGSDALEVTLINKNYSKQCSTLRNKFILLIFCIYAYCMSYLLKSYHLILIDFAIILCLLLLLWHLNRLTKTEKFLFCYDFGIHFQVEKCLGKRNRFVAASNIHDIVINEVIENLDFRYLLILRTKGALFQKTPIIPIFKIFKPSYECLSLVYKHLNKVMIKSKI
ncbi:phosphatidylinositol glycan anchor biosynthesis class H [Cochliomyia hominivorax]